MSMANEGSGAVETVAVDAVAVDAAASKDAAAREVFAALVELHLLWASTEQHGRMAERLGIEMNDSDVRALYSIGMLQRAVRPAELALLTHSSRPTISRTLDRLAAAGLVDRVSHESDRRGSLVQLTDTGASTYLKFVDGTVSLVHTAVAEIDTETVQTLSTTIRSFTAAHKLTPQP